MSTDPSSTFQVELPTLRSDDYVAYHGNDALAIMTVRDRGVVLTKDLNCTQSTLLIYSEVVFLSSELIKIPGLNLGIFCNRLVLSLGNACIDVSGANGSSGTSDHIDGVRGGHAGSITLYVEDPSPDLVTNLTLKAYGGDGGRGFSQALGTGAPGKGGDGGLCGAIKCYTGSGAQQYAQSLYKKTSKSTWTEWVQAINETTKTDVDALLGYGIDKTIVEAWQSAVKKSLDLANVVKKAHTSLTYLVDENSMDPDHVSPGALTVKSAETLLKSVKKLLEGSRVPFAQDGLGVEAFLSLADHCDSFTGSVQKEKQLQESIGSVTTLAEKLTRNEGGGGEEPWEDEPFSSPNFLLKKILLDLRVATVRFENALAHKVCQLGGGKGGSGGTGATSDIPSGKRGEDQPDKPAVARVISLEGNAKDCDIDDACVIPEQCQMLLDKADGMYFTNSELQYPSAMRLYYRLTRRLAFLDALAKDKEPSNRPLAKAYGTIETKYALTTDALGQLDRIYEAAKSRLKKMKLGQDMFCQSPTWVPRLSLTFYEQRVKNMLENFSLIEKVYGQYAEAEQREQVLKDQVSNARQTNDINISAARNQIDLLTKPGGELDTAGITIAQYSPKLAAERKKLGVGLEKLKKCIEGYFHVSTENLLEAFCMISFAPHAPMIAVQGAEVLYKSWTKVENLEGMPVQKEYIVDKLETCRGTISSLTESYKFAKNGELTVDDPGYGKVLATADTLQQLLNDFKKAIPKELQQTVQADVKKFIELVAKRNDAVIVYNAQVQYLLELKRMVKALEQESKNLGEQALTLSPSLPAIYFWLKRLRNATQLDILQRLNYEGRALAFWGPLDIKTVTFDPPGPLDGSVQLRNHQEKLEKMFEDCYGALQGGAWNHWPGSRNLVEAGTAVDVSNDVLDQLRNPVPSTGGDGGQESEVYEAVFSITPRSNRSFLDMANVRLTQVRVWLLGATVSGGDDEHSPQWLKVEVEHIGGETVWDQDGTPFKFAHAPVHLQFTYNTTTFNAERKFSGDSKLVYGRQAIENDFSGRGGGKPKAEDRPPLGPFTDWRIQIRRDVNPGLDLTGVTKVWIEFCGRNLPAAKLKDA